VGVPELLTASYYLLGQVLDQVSALNSRVASLEAQVKSRGCGSGGDKGGGGSSRSQKKKKKRVVDKEEDSELSKSEAGRGEDGGC
jgi:hypothetical protein